MAHIAPGENFPLDEAPMLVGDFNSLANQIKPVAGKPMTFTAQDLIRPDKFDSLELIPFFRVHDARYMLYWRTVTPQQAEQVIAEMETRERESITLATRTVDQVTPGEQQPEVEHNFRGENSESGVNRDRPWRDARNGGWFSYEMSVDSNAPMTLRCTYWGGDGQNRNFDILIGGERIATQRLEAEQPDRFFDKDYPIPPALTRGRTKVTVRFQAHPGNTAGGIYGVWMMRAMRY
jgi:hypothetical protein